MISPTSEQYDLLQRRLKERLEESHGETIYDVGIDQGRLTSTFLKICLKTTSNCVINFFIRWRW